MGNLAKSDYNHTPPDQTDLLAPVSFDDFHNSIMAEPSLNHFPMPGTAVSNHTRSPLSGPFTRNPWADNDESSFASRSRSNSMRRKSEVSHLSSQNSSAESVASRLPASNTAARSRRQSLVQNSAAKAPAPRAPRKSIGPGSIAATTSARRQSVSARKASVDTSPADHASLRPHAQNPDSSGLDKTRLPSNVRNMKAKSLQPPSREPGDHLLTASGLTDHSRSCSTNAVRTPIKNPAGSATTPASSAKRVSVMPPHATGLGARTISPTDARRMKRISTAPQAPPLPYTPPTKQDTLPVRPRSCAQSPSSLPRKSVTPSSTRTTPDPSRKSYSSGLSLSSNTSYSSTRNSGSSLQTRFAQNQSSSRLPTPKPRAEHMGGNNEEVPPVPAIPKAYESPKGDGDFHTYFASRKSSLPSDIGLPKPKADHDAVPKQAIRGNDKKTTDHPAEREMKTPDAKTPASNFGKKNLQPLKLPPLNLLPLSTPVTSKIEALKDREDDGQSYTPSGQAVSKTPSTPMTASKANFSFRDEDDTMGFTHARSSTSHFVLSTSTVAPLRTASSSSALASFDNNTTGGARTISPYVSYTLPKSSSDFSNLQQKANTSGDYSPRISQAYKLTGPRPQTQSSAFSSNAETISQLSTPSDPDNNSVPGSSIFNRITLTGKRSDSKSQRSTGADLDPAKQMPPPRLPASATWNNLSTVKGSSPTLKPAYVQARRQSSISGTSVSTMRNQSVSSEQSLALEPSVSNESGESNTASLRPGSSVFSPMHKMINSAKSSTAATPRQQHESTLTLTFWQPMRRCADSLASARTLRLPPGI
ncbi:protein kinase [Aspergillus fumigatus]|nr:protein kinase [Aspergillus fumigatus]